VVTEKHGRSSAKADEIVTVASARLHQSISFNGASQRDASRRCPAHITLKTI
jgi:hypothetical protein